VAVVEVDDAHAAVPYLERVSERVLKGLAMSGGPE